MPSPPASRTSASAPVGAADSKYSKKVEQFISIPYPSISSDQHFQYLLCRRISLATAWSVMKCHESSWNILETYNHLILFSSCMAALPRTVTFTTSAEMPKTTVKANSSNAKAWQSYCQVPFVSASQEMYSFELDEMRLIAIEYNMAERQQRQALEHLGIVGSSGFCRGSFCLGSSRRRTPKACKNCLECTECTWIIVHVR